MGGRSSQQTDVCIPQRAKKEEIVRRNFHPQEEISAKLVGVISTKEVVGLTVGDYLCMGPFHEDQNLDAVGSFLVKVQKYPKCRHYIVPVTEQCCAGWNL